MIATVWRAMLAAAPVKIWAQIGAAMAFTLVLVGFGLVIWLGPWIPARQAQQIDWLGYGMVSAALLALVALAAITGLNVNLKAGKDGLTGSIDQDERATQIETITKTTVTPPDGAPVTTEGTKSNVEV